MVCADSLKPYFPVWPAPAGHGGAFLSCDMEPWPVTVFIDHQNVCYRARGQSPDDRQTKSAPNRITWRTRERLMGAYTPTIA